MPDNPETPTTLVSPLSPSGLSESNSSVSAFKSTLRGIIQQLKQLSKNDPNKVANIVFRIVMNGFGKPTDFVIQWISFAGFFFSVLPGILSLMMYAKHYAEKDLDCEATRIRPIVGLPGLVTVMGIILPISITIFQWFVFQRFMFLKLWYPVFVGQVLAVVFFFLTTSRPVLRWFARPIHDNIIIGLFALVLFCLCIGYIWGGLDRTVLGIIVAGAVMLFGCCFLRSVSMRLTCRIIFFLGALAIMVFVFYIAFMIHWDVMGTHDGMDTIPETPLERVKQWFSKESSERLPPETLVAAAMVPVML